MPGTRTGRILGAVACVAALAIPAGAARAEQATPGTRAPDFELSDLGRRVVRLSDLAYPGPERPGHPRHVVLLDFFRSDCPPCRGKLPLVVEMHQRMKARGLATLLIGVGVEGEAGFQAQLAAWMDLHPVPFPVLVDGHGGVARDYITRGREQRLGLMVLVDRNGVVRAVSDDAATIERAADALTQP